MEAINNIKNYLLHLERFDDVETFSKLQEEIRNLIGKPGILIGITPFFFINDRLVFSAIHSVNSIFLKNLDSQEDKEAAAYALKNHFDTNSSPIIIPEITEESLLSYSFIPHLQQQGWNGLILCPLRNYNNLVGVLEIVSNEAGIIGDEILQNIDIALPLFELAVNKSYATLEARLNKVIKDQFTAIQPSVEWKFTEGAINYLLRSETDEDVKMEPIRFDNVYPLYGAIDIRNSSTERNIAIQKDMLEQLDLALTIIKKAKNLKDFPLLRQVEYKIRKYQHSVSNIVLSDEELAINMFFKKEVVELFGQLKEIVPTLEPDIDNYFNAIQSSVEMVYRHRKEFDDSIMLINKTIARFIDREQKTAQDIYPHYFERFITDGVDFNIYIGQSIAPRIPFSHFFLRNLKIWQLATLTRAAILANDLEKELPVPLKTTLLILAHHFPISISFRYSERKFDVDGAYNIRYEIIKKRIDKVHIRDTNERLTQPGKIAIVYSQPDEVNEYLEYIEFLLNDGLLKGEIEWHELEELQGVSGLKAIRIEVNLSEEKKKSLELKSNTHKR